MSFAPRFAPNGKDLAMSAASKGSSDIYVMNKDGSDQKRISFGQGHY